MNNSEERPAAVNFTKAINLDKQIEVVEETDSQGLVVFRFVSFKLDKNSVNKILNARSQGEKLYLGRDLLDDLRTCALSEGEHKDGGNRLQSGMTFCTYYQKNGDTSANKILMRSAISLDGDIINQVRKECLNNPQKSLAIATAHHWLIAQITQQISIKSVSYQYLEWKIWAIALGVAVVALILALINVIPWWLFGLIAVIAAVAGFFLPRQVAIRHREWIQWLAAFLSPNGSDRAKRIWRKLVS
jgi:predicted RND superfamily exporter protein